jgi:DNA mismatch repair protein MutL
VTARELFHNTPARREFLRTAAAERRAILDVVSMYALLHPQLQILLRADDRDLLDLRPAATRRERVAEILGRPMEQNLVEVKAEKDAVLVEGLASRPPYGFRNRSQQIVFVNGRPVKDRTVSFAISHAYRHTMEPDRFPVVVLFLSLPTGQVDINVHPTKSEVRFRDDRLLHQVLVRALRHATGSLEGAEIEQAPGAQRAASALRPWQGGGPPQRPGSEDGMQIAEHLLGRDAGTTAGAPPVGARPYGPQAGPRDSESGSQPRLDLGGAALVGDAGEGLLQEGSAPNPELLGDEALYWQLHNAYILIQIRSGLVIVDQHAAHERVLYDRAVTTLETRQPNVQRLLFPITLELSVQQYAAWEEGRELLDQLGFEVRPFGARSVIVDGIPSEMTAWEEGAVLLGILDDLADNRDGRRLPLRDRVLATYACRAAIMQGRRLSLAEMRALMDQLFVTARPYTCPHGRPTLMRLGLRDLDHKFGRP